jgi:hypothetical protein
VWHNQGWSIWDAVSPGFLLTFARCFTHLQTDAQSIALERDFSENALKNALNKKPAQGR